MTEPKKPMFLCTRPRLASAAMQEGITCELVPNPYNPQLKAWEIPLTESNRAFITAFYEQNGITLPAALTKGV